MGEFACTTKGLAWRLEILRLGEKIAPDANRRERIFGSKGHLAPTLWMQQHGRDDKCILIGRHHAGKPGTGVKRRGPEYELDVGNLQV